jgi:hypothetical protein
MSARAADARATASRAAGSATEFNRITVALGFLIGWFSRKPVSIFPRHALYTRMPKKPGTNPKGEFAFFDVFYEDGSQRSNRRVPTTLLGGLEDDDKVARGFLIEQDREIAEKSGRAPLQIKSIRRVGAKKKKDKSERMHAKAERE